MTSLSIISVELDAANSYIYRRTPAIQKRSHQWLHLWSGTAVRYIPGLPYFLSVNRMHVCTIGVPTDYGANRRGVDMGPSAIRYAGLAETIERTGNTCNDFGDLEAVGAPHAFGERSDRRLQCFEEIRDVCTTLSDRVESAHEKDALPLVLGGDHSIAIGTLTGTSRAANVGVLWLDAHGDFNTPETTPSGNVHGMALAAALGLGEFADHGWPIAPGIEAKNVALVGLRSLDAEEQAMIQESDVAAYTMSEIDARGITTVVDEALSTVTAETDGLHLSLDMDFLDPNEAPGVGTPVRGGVTYREAHAALELVARRVTPRSIDVVEINPILDRHNETAELACELIASTLGERTL